jgi:3-phosphoshikimate 1-carboxyvinyltransferase
VNIEIILPSSKSISNRLLIMNALSGNQNKTLKISESKDTTHLQLCLNSDATNLYVGEGATTLRFLLAYLCLKNKKVCLDSSKSLQTRPLKELLDALHNMGCHFDYQEAELHLPLCIEQGIQDDYPSSISIDASQSSQFVSAMLMIAPYLKNGLILHFTGTRVSQSYINMTVSLMKQFGIVMEETKSYIKISPSNYSIPVYEIEADWSAAAYFYTLTALIPDLILSIPGLKQSGLQGDEILVDFFKQFGVMTLQKDHGVEIFVKDKLIPKHIAFNFTDYPDLFPPIAIFCALCKVNCHFTGLQHLEYKESNRLKIICDFLKNQNVKMDFSKTAEGELSAMFFMNTFDENIPDTFSSHNDHRIAMSFSLLSVIRAIHITNPAVVAKSFPDYWNQFAKMMPGRIL